MDTTSAEAAHDVKAAKAELAFIHDVVARTHRRMDPHAFHFVHWGCIVLVWYPLSNWLQSEGRLSDMAWLGGSAVALGFVLSFVREARLARRPRLTADNTFLTRQISMITFTCIAAGAVLSGVAPAFGFIDGPNVPIIWGLVYANMAVMTGVVYNRDFLWAGLVIFAGSLAAIVFQPAAGYILGPCMGLGMIIPARRAEQRVRAMLAAEDDTTDTGSDEP